MIREIVYMAAATAGLYRTWKYLCGRCHEIETRLPPCVGVYTYRIDLMFSRGTAMSDQKFYHSGLSKTVKLIDTAGIGPSLHTSVFDSTLRANLQGWEFGHISLDANVVAAEVTQRQRLQTLNTIRKIRTLDRSTLFPAERAYYDDAVRAFKKINKRLVLGASSIWLAKIPPVSSIYPSSITLCTTVKKKNYSKQSPVPSSL